MHKITTSFLHQRCLYISFTIRTRSTLSVVDLSKNRGLNCYRNNSSQHTGRLPDSTGVGSPWREQRMHCRAGWIGTQIFYNKGSQTMRAMLPTKPMSRFLFLLLQNIPTNESNGVNGGMKDGPNAAGHLQREHVSEWRSKWRPQPVEQKLYAKHVWKYELIVNKP